MTSLVFVPKRLVADGQARDSHNDPHVRESNGNQGVYWNALVFLSARVLSHCGFLLVRKPPIQQKHDVNWCPTELICRLDGMVDAHSTLTAVSTSRH